MGGSFLEEALALFIVVPRFLFYNGIAQLEAPPTLRGELP